MPKSAPFDQEAIPADGGEGVASDDGGSGPAASLPRGVAPHLPPEGPRHRRKRRWGRRRIALLVVVVLLAPVAWSYGNAMSAPSADPIGLRTIEWMKDHGMRRWVLWIEREYYTHHAPKVGAALKAGAIAPPVSSDPAATDPGHAPPAKPADIVPFVANPVPGEGVWRPTGRSMNGAVPVYTTFLRPDALHTGLVTGVAWMNSALLKAELFAGTSDPGGVGWTNQSPVALGVRPNLFATFNSGFKLRDSKGGYYAEGRTVRPLIIGRASLVFHKDGTATVADWGRDAVMGPDVAAVRQNLSLMVDGGHPVPGLDKDNYTLWGYTLGNKVLVWRSGVGVDASGNLIYVAGNGLSVKSLADVLAAAGAVRAMELDINSEWVDFMTYDGGAFGSPVAPTKLLKDMQPAADKYFHLSTRDFIALVGR
jgi:hypothetical protein